MTDATSTELAEIEAKLNELAEVTERILELTRRISDLAVRVHETLVGPVEDEIDMDQIRGDGLAPPNQEERAMTSEVEFEVGQIRQLKDGRKARITNITGNDVEIVLEDNTRQNVTINDLEDTEITDGSEDDQSKQT